MNMRHLILLGTLAAATNAYADNSTLNAAIGGGVGAAIGNEVGGREGAILGGAIGAAVGTSGSDNREHTHAAPSTGVRVEVKPEGSGHPGYHCPPGQAKKGRC